MIFIYIFIILLIIIQSNKEKFMITAKWDPNFIYESYYPPYRKFSRQPQDKFYSTWCEECWLDLNSCREKSERLEKELNELKKNIK
jgi:hypothetical protein